MIHLVFGESATGSLKYAFRKQNHKIIGFPMDFSIGTITNIHENRGIKSYFTWLEYSFHTVWGNFENNQTEYQQSLQKLLDIKDDDQVTIWTCEKDGEELLQSTSNVRSWKQGKIINESETRDDSFIMECVRRLHSESENIEFINATRVIGEVIGLSEQVVSDAWIEYRECSLIYAGQLAYEGSLYSMRMYKVKPVQ